MNTHKTTSTLLAALCALVALIATTPAHALETRKITATFGEATLGEAYRPIRLAIDQATGNVYVGAYGANVTYNREGSVDVFNAEGGAPAGGIPAQLSGAETPGGAFGGQQAPQGLAVDDSCYYQGLGGARCKAFDPSSGDLYVGSGGTPEAFDKFALNGSSKYEYLCQFTGFAACATLGPSSALHDVGGVAVDADGNVYVGFFFSGSGNEGALIEYDPKGEPIRQLTQVMPTGIAVDRAGDIYFTGFSKGASCLCEIRRSPTGDFLEPEVFGGGSSAVAVDTVTGHVFVGSDSGVEELDPNRREVIASFGLPSDGVAVNSETNEVYVSVVPRGRVGESNEIVRFGPPVTLVDVTTGGVSSLHRTSTTLEGEVTPYGLATKYFFQYGESGEYGSSTPVLSTSVKTAALANVVGLAPGTTYHYRLVAENANGANYGQDQTFTTPVAVEGVVTGAANAIGATGATLTGSLEPDGEAAFDWFEYGPANGPAGAYGTATGRLGAGSASEAVPAEAAIAGLEPNATYHYRLAAEDGLGTSYGADSTLKTLPAPPGFDQAPSASQVTRAGAFVQGAVNPENSQTTAHIVYVDEAGYAPSSGEPYAAGGSTAEVPVGAGFGDQPVEQQVGGLEPQTTYHYAIVATNRAGTSVSADATFTTGAATPPIVSTGGASGVTANTATLTATVATQGLPATYGFEIGTGSTEYGPPTGLGFVGAGAGEETVALALTGLLPGTTYHYRVTATNVDGTSYGADQSFTTPVFPGTFTTPPAALPLLASTPIAFPVEAKTVVLKKVKSKPKTRTRKKAGKKAKRKVNPPATKHKKR